MTLERFSRWQAARFHLGISVVIAATVVATMLLLWYPQPYFAAAGGHKLLLLLIGVDVIIGPLLTAIVFDPRKKHLVLDLAVIAMLQAGALAYGASVMFNARPVYIAFAGDRFELVEANAIAPSDLELAARAFRTLPSDGPKVVGTRLPANPKERERLGFAAVLGASIGLFPQYYVPYPSVAADAAARAQPLARLRERRPAAAAEVDAWLKARGRAESAVRFLPLQARLGPMTVLVAADSGEVLGVLALAPD